MKNNTIKKSFEFENLTGTLTIEDPNPNKYGNICTHFSWGEIDEYPTFRSMEQIDRFLSDADVLADFIDQSVHNG